MASNKSFISAAKPFESFASKAEEMLAQQYPGLVDSGNYDTIHIGRNTDAGIGTNGGFRVRGTARAMQDALYFETPEKMLGDEVLADETLKRRFTETRASDAVKLHAASKVQELVSSGVELKEAQKRVNDSIDSAGYYDAKAGKFITERVAKRVSDSVLAGMATPPWDIAQIQKVFKQPFLKGEASGIITKLGIPNVWADFVQIFTETFEGYARVSNVAKTMGTFNTSIAAKNRTGTMLSELINLVIDYESPQVQENAIGSMPGNWLTGATMGHRDAYANLMLEQLMNVLIYFGHDETGFEGLTQIATRDACVEQYDGVTAATIWENEANGDTGTAGADLLIKLSHMLADRVEELLFLPTSCKVRCSPILYKVLKFSMTNKTYNQNNPLSLINTIYESGNKIVGTMATKSLNGAWQSFEIVPDPMLMPGTPFNPGTADLMFIAFPSIQSALDGGETDLIMAPVPIDKMVLPSAPGYRDGVVRTALKRVGSILAPVEKLVHRIEGFGINDY